MKSFFEPTFFRGNRQRLKLAAQNELIVITANGILQRTGDTTYPFRQDSNFWYLTGINDPDVILVMDGENEYIIVPTRDPIREAFDGQLDGEVFTRTSGIADIVPARAGRERLFKRLKKLRQVATLSPAAGYLDFHGFYTNPARAHLLRQLKGVCSNLEVEDLRPTLASMRMRKQKPELTAMQSAINITLETLNEISQRNFAGYSHEFELEAAITAGFRKRGAGGHAFPPIVASGVHACQIHHMENNGPVVKGSQLLFDIAAEVSNYSSDISRTYFIGQPSSRYLQVYDAVKVVYDFALTQLKPGINVRDYEKLIETFMGEQLIGLGLIKSLDKKEIRHYYPHATSHFLGLDTHDAGDYSEPLEANMVLTVEPGIYIPEEGIGIRIEDDVMITNKGNKILSVESP